MNALPAGPALRTPPATATGAPPWRALFAVVFACSWCGNQFSPLLLMYRHLQHYSDVMVNLFLGVYVLGLAPALLLTGALSDRYGRRPVMTAGVLTAIAASTTLAFGPLGTAALVVGRLLSGVTVGIAMAVGNAWLKEVSQAPHDPAADAGSGARRASLAFALGSGTGALVAGAIAQWGPWKEVLPFAVHVAVTLPCVWLVRRVPETRAGGAPVTVRERLRVPAAAHPRFLRVVLPCAPWLFGAAGIGYGYLPVLLAPATGRWGLAFATGLVVIALGVAALVQPWAKRLDHAIGARALLVTMGFVVAGLLLAVAAHARMSLALGVLDAVVMGAAIGIGLVSGLLEVQRIAGPDRLAGLTGVFYALAYAGFLLPALLAAITPPFTTGALLLSLAGVAVGCAALAAWGSRTVA